MLQSTFRLRWALTALLAAQACAGSNLTPKGLAQTKDSHRLTDTVRAIQAAEPAVVNIEGNKPSGKIASGEPQQVNGMGSGVIIDPRGYILTNQHVVQDVTRIEVTLYDGTKYIGRLIDHDPSTDLALIKIDAPREVPVIRFGTSSDLMRGEKVVAIGNPFGYQHTVTEGIISALHRDIPVNGVQEYEDLIQTDASINPGNSGGPLVNIDGAMIGLNAAVRVGAQGIGFAIPVDKAVEVAANLISTHRKYAVDVPFNVRTDYADGRTEVRVHQVRSTKAAALDLADGDRIKRVGSRTVRNRLEYELALLDQPLGKQLDIELERDGRALLAQVETQPRSASSVSLVSARNGDQSAYAWNVLGVRLKPADAHQIQQVDTSYNGGLVIVAVREQSPAEHAQLHQGDILVGLLDWQTPNWKDLEWIFSSAEMKSSTKPKFRIIRGKGVYYGTFDLTH
ncbi:MAG: S1C family serine protease [Aureliella sp.]